MGVEKADRFARESQQGQLAAVTAERDELLARLREEEIVADNMEAELTVTARRLRALEQELLLAWQRVELLEEQLQYQREPLRRRAFRRRPGAE